MHSRVEHWCRRSSSSSLCGAHGALSTGPSAHNPPLAGGPQARPHLVASVPQALQGQTLTLRVEKIHQGLGQGKKAEPSEAQPSGGPRLRLVDPLLTPHAPLKPRASGGECQGPGAQVLLTQWVGGQEMRGGQDP